MKNILVEISSDGEVKISASGFKGTDCLDATKALEKALGNVKERTPTKEMTEKTRVIVGAKV